MSYVRIYLHTVWSTKNRYHLLGDKFRSQVFDHIKENAKLKDIFIDQINGFSDHVHCLISMKAKQNISEIMQTIKGESAHWINQQGFMKSKFFWQTEYFAVSIGESQLGAIRRYIQGQPEHHRKKTFQQEYDKFIKIYGFVIMHDPIKGI